MTRISSRISTAVALSFQGVIVLVGWLAVWLMGVDILSGSTGWLKAVAWGISGSIVTYLLLSALARAPGPIRDSLSGHMRQLHGFANDYSWPVLMTLSVLAGVGEELLFRGAVQGWLAWHLNDALAILLASLLFGLVHYLSFAYFVMATGLGLVLGIAYWMTDSLLLVMVWHGVYDIIALYSLRRYPHVFGVH
jgi:membrane protease YdiL (CAAX protease family)